MEPTLKVRLIQAWTDGHQQGWAEVQRIQIQGTEAGTGSDGEAETWTWMKS